MQTCPVVNWIYPVHLRVLASEGMHELVKTEEGAPLDEYPDTFEESKSVNEDALGGMLAKGARLGVIVDRMEHLQGLMDLLSCFVPFTSDSKLAVTGKSFISIELHDSPLTPVCLSICLSV